MRQGIKPVVNHPQGVAQVLLALLPSGQIGKIGGNARIVRWLIIFIETNALDGKCEFFVHSGLCFLIPEVNHWLQPW
jgi:hypothetical protein